MGVLLIGDILVGGMWMIRFDHLTKNLEADLHGRLRAEYSDPSSQFRELFDDLQSKSQCCGVESPLDYNGSFWQMTETRYFLDYERALNTSLISDHVDVEEEEEIAENETNQNQTEDDVDLHHVDSDDLLLPW